LAGLNIFDSLIKIPEILDEYFKFLSQKAEKMEKYNQLIETEKTKITTVFDNIIVLFINLITDKKKEYFEILDQKLTNLHNHYELFETNLKKAFPAEQDIPNLFPSKETLLTQLTSITDLDKLKFFVKDLNEDMNEDKEGIGKGKNLQERRQLYVQNLKEKILNIFEEEPVFRQERLDLNSIQKVLELEVNEFLKNSLRFKISLLNSLLIKQEDFEDIRDWLPQDIVLNPKLIYRGSRDGLSPKHFHTRCDGKSNTITIMKIRFSMGETFILGGYLDQKWHSSENYIQSSKAFIFSVTSKIVCPVSNDSYAAYGSQYNGPSFGGNDLLISSNYEGHMSKNSYEKIIGLLEYKKCHNVRYEAMQTFQVIEMEVYTLD